MDEPRTQLVRELGMEKTFDSLPVAVLVLDAHATAILECNAAATEMFGYGRDELVGQCLALVCRDQAILAELEARSPCAAADRLQFEHAMRRKDGTTFPAEHRLTPLKDEHGQCTSWLSVAQDITERKRAEEALRESVERYRLVADFTHDWEDWVDPAGKYIYISPSCERITGYCPDEFIQDHGLLEAITHPDDRAVIARHIREGSQNYSCSFDFRIVTRDGRLRWINHTCQAIYDAGGRWLGKRGSNRDITDRVQVEEALRRSEERYRRLLESVTDYVYTVEIENGRPTMTSHGPGCVAVTGYTAEEYAANPYLWHRMVHDEDKEAVVEQAARIFAGKAAPLEHRIIHKDGSIRWVRNTPVLRYDSQGRLVAYDGLITDITKRKQTEQALQESEEKYRAVVQASVDAILVETLEGRILDCNTAACKMYGYVKEELIRLNVSDLVPDQVAAVLAELVAGELASGGMFVETLNQRKDGEIFPCEISTRIITIGGEQRVIAYVRDITERKRAEQARLGEMEAEARAAAAEAAQLTLEREIAERKWVENALRESEARYRTLVEQIPAVTYIAALDESSTTFYISPQVEAILGYSQADYEADSDLWRKKLYADDYERVMAELARCHASQEPFVAEYRMWAGDGRVLWFRDEATVIWDNVGQPLFLQGVMFDITGRIQTEEALKRRAAQLALINDIGKKIAAALDLDEVLARATRLAQTNFNYHHVGIFIIDYEHNQAVLRAAAGSYLTFPKDHRLGLNEGMVGWTATHNAMRLSNDVRADPYYIASFAVTQSELCVPIRIGEQTIGVLDTQSPQLDGFDESDVLVLETLADQIAVAIANAGLFEQAQREISERKRAEEALRRRNEELMARNTIATTIGQSLDLDHILNVTLDIVLDVIGVEAGWIQLANHGQDTPSNLAVQRGLGLSADVLKQSETLADQVIRLGQSSVTTDLLAGPLLNPPAPHRGAPLACVAVPIKSKDRTLGALGVCAAHPRQLNPHEVQLLTAVGHQMGVAIENVQLAEEAAEIETLRTLERLRSELIANISHELRTPLGLIEVFCTTLLREDVEFDDKTQREFLGNIKEETGNLEELVDNLLDMSRMQSGRLRLDKHLADLGLLAEKIIKAMGFQLAQHRFVYDFPAEPLIAAVDSKDIEQVLRNLLSNAIKYSPTGGVITVRGRQDQDHFVIQVSDQGIGIPHEETEKVFERFYRVQNEVTQSTRGAGLGLAVCRGIVEAHGGQIWVESTPGTGSTFSFTLPTAP